MNTGKDNLNQMMNTHYVLLMCGNGIRKILKSWVLIALVFFFLSGVAASIIAVHVKINGTLAPMYHCFYTVAIVVLSSVVAMMLLWCLGLPTGFLKIMGNMHRIGLKNAAGEVPALLTREPVANNPSVERWEFESYGVPFSAWEDHTEKLESGLDIAVIRIEQGKSARRVILTVIPHPPAWPEIILWNVSMLPQKQSVLALGDNRCEQVAVDLSIIPHVLVAGRTGSGKSVLLKTFMLQALLKGMKVVIVDYKGGVDFSRNWPLYCEIITEDDGFLKELTDLLNLMKTRLSLLRADGSVNIDEYNKKHKDKMDRVCLFVDEVAECLDKSGASAERKKIIGAIELSLSNLCRLGRAVGIHVFLGMQRGSADILSGQIRNNVYKILGSCDENLSILTLGNANAAKRIPKDARGRFLDEMGNMFQVYYSEFGHECFVGIPTQH